MKTIFVMTFLALGLREVVADPCPPGYPVLDRRPEANHGDVCRNQKNWPYGVGWTCPIECKLVSKTARPYCTEKSGSNQPCRVNGVKDVKSCPIGFRLEKYTDYWGNDIKCGGNLSADQAAAKCKADAACLGFSLRDNGHPGLFKPWCLKKALNKSSKRNNHHFCVKEVKDTNTALGLNGKCWDSRKTMEQRDATCGEGLVCARRGYEDRSFGGCARDSNGNLMAVNKKTADHHCCSLDEASCSHEDRLPLGAFKESFYTQHGKRDNVQDRVFDFALPQPAGARIKLAGWNKIRDYQQGFSNDKDTPAYATITGLEPLRTYKFALYQFVRTYEDLTRAKASKVIVQGAEYVTDIKFENASPTFEGAIQADKAGEVVFEFRKLGPRAIISGISIWDPCNAPATYKMGAKGSNACPWGYVPIKDHAECKAAGDHLDAALHRTPSGSWGHVPPYCSYQSGGDQSVHFNTKTTGKNDGNYTPICLRGTGDVVFGTVDKDLKKSVPHTLDMISLNVRIYNGHSAGDTVKAETTGNWWKVVADLSDSSKIGRLWLAELEEAKTCALVVRGSQGRSFFDNVNTLPEKMPGTDYWVVKGYQDHIWNIMMHNHNSKKIDAWLQKCHDRSFQKIFSGHSLGGTVATWLSMWYEIKKESLRPDYVVTFGQPRLVTRYGSDRCPRSLQTRTKAVRIVTATDGTSTFMSTVMLGLGKWVDAASLLPPDVNPMEKFCFESLSLDDWGNLLEQDAAFPNWKGYVSTVNHATGGWELHFSESRYQPYLIKARDKLKDDDCVVSETCDNLGNFWGKGNCKEVCCHGVSWKGLYHVCKAGDSCMKKDTWCDKFGILTESCGKCCSRSTYYKWNWLKPWESAHYCK